MNGVYVLFRTTPEGFEEYFQSFAEDGKVNITRNVRSARPFATARHAYLWAGKRRVLADWRVGTRPWAGSQFLASEAA